MQQSQLWAMAYGHSFGLPPEEPPFTIAEKHKVFLFCLALTVFVSGCDAACRGFKPQW